jgi:hypothetical protein
MRTILAIDSPFLKVIVLAGVSGSLDQLKQFGNGKRKRCRKAFNVYQAQIPGAAFNVAQVRTVNPRLVGEIFLRQQQLFASRLDGDSDTHANVGFCLFSHCGDVNRM